MKSTTDCVSHFYLSSQNTVSNSAIQDKILRFEIYNILDEMHFDVRMARPICRS